MLEKLKSILLEEKKGQIAIYNELLEKIESLEKEYKSINQPEFILTLPPKDPSNKNNIFHKFFKRNKYKQEIKEYKIKKEEYDNIKEEIKEQEHKYYEERPRIQEKISKLKKELEYFQEIKNEYENIKNARSLKDLDLNIIEAMNIFKQYNIPFVLTTEDNIEENESDFDQIEDFILVHKTKYAPNNNEIKTLTNSNVTSIARINTGKESISVEYKEKRDTVHFEVNGEVTSSTGFSSFNSRKYAIIIPLEDVPNIINFSTVDTYSNGNVKIEKGIILCPEEEVEEIQKNNPNTMVIGYQGKQDVDNFANVLLSMLGYKYENANEHSWLNKEDETKVINNMPSIKMFQFMGAHSGSYESKREKINTSISFLLSLIKKIKTENIDIDPEYLANCISGIDDNFDYTYQLTTDMYDLGYYTDEVGKIYKDLLESLRELDINIPYYVENLREIINDNLLEETYNYIKDQDLCNYLQKCEKQTSKSKLPICALLYEIFKQLQSKKEKII